MKSTVSILHNQHAPLIRNLRARFMRAYRDKILHTWHTLRPTSIHADQDLLVAIDTVTCLVLHPSRVGERFLQALAFIRAGGAGEDACEIVQEPIVGGTIAAMRRAEAEVVIEFVGAGHLLDHFKKRMPSHPDEEVVLVLHDEQVGIVVHRPAAVRDLPPLDMLPHAKNALHGAQVRALLERHVRHLADEYDRTVPGQHLVPVEDRARAMGFVFLLQDQESPDARDIRAFFVKHEDNSDVFAAREEIDGLTLVLTTRHVASVIARHLLQLDQGTIQSIGVPELGPAVQALLLDGEGRFFFPFDLHMAES